MTSDRVCKTRGELQTSGVTANIRRQNSDFGWSERLTLEVTPDVKFYATRSRSVYNNEIAYIYLLLCCYPLNPLKKKIKIYM